MLLNPDPKRIFIEDFQGRRFTSGSRAAPTLGGADLPCCCRGHVLRRGLCLWHPLGLHGGLCPCGESTSCCCWGSQSLSCSSPGSGTRCDQCMRADWGGRQGQCGQRVRLCCSPLYHLSLVSPEMRMQTQMTRFSSVSGSGLCCRTPQPFQ
jgi:hypothetical protein